MLPGSQIYEDITIFKNKKHDIITHETIMPVIFLQICVLFYNVDVLSAAAPNPSRTVRVYFIL